MDLEAGASAVRTDPDQDPADVGSADPAPAPNPGSDPGVRRVVASLVAGVFVGGLGGGVAFPTLPALGTVLAISPLVVGIILSVNRFVRLLVNAPAGAVLDRKSVV